MKLKVKTLGIEAGKQIAVLNRADAEEFGLRAGGRIKVKFNDREATAIVNLTERFVPRGWIGVYKEIKNSLSLEEGVEVEVDVSRFPKSLQYIKERIIGRKLGYWEFYEIVKDVIEKNLSEAEIASFVSALQAKTLSLEEAADLSLAMVETGETLRLGKKLVLDKHSIGGCVGDKTSIILVPIIASVGYTIPKTSSRAITSAAGTADKAECLMPVGLSIEEMKTVVEKTNGCLVWGGALHLAPADDIFIQVEYSLGIDPLLFPSIMSKKRAVGATHLVIDIPTGRGTKVKTIGDANLLAKDFIELGDKLDIKTVCAITYGEQPIGNAIGPGLEAREALEILEGKEVLDQLDKATDLAELLLKTVGVKNGKKIATEAVKSGKAREKLKEIIEAQGGNPRVKPSDMPIGQYTYELKAERSCYVLWIDNSKLIEIARAAGAPKDKGAGIYLTKKILDKVKSGEEIMRVYAEMERKLDRAIELIETLKPIGVGNKMKMLIQTVEERPYHRKTFFLER